MKNIATTIIFVLTCFSGFSQSKIFVLHPITGDTIDKTEKIKYLLFPEVESVNFRYATITHPPEGYFLHYYNNQNQLITLEIDSAELKQYRANLEKLSDYYSGVSKKDSVKSGIKSQVELNDVVPQNINGVVISDETKDRISKETTRDTRMKDDAERKKRYEEGNDITGGGAYIEFFKKKKKK